MVCCENRILPLAVLSLAQDGAHHCGFGSIRQNRKGAYPRSGQLSHQHRACRLARTPCLDGLPNDFGDIDPVKAF